MLWVILILSKMQLKKLVFLEQFGTHGKIHGVVHHYQEGELNIQLVITGHLVKVMFI